MQNILLNIPPLKQGDPSWGNDKMGSTQITLSSEGCLVTCATMLLKFLLKKEITPGDLNTWLKNNSGYQNGNLFVWGSLSSYDSRINFGYRYNYPALDKIDQQLLKGIPVIVEVDHNRLTPAVDQHWVLVVGKVNGFYIINDPWLGTQLQFQDRYGAAVSGMFIVATYDFAGDTEPQVPEDEEPLFSVKVKNGVDSLIIRSSPFKSSATDTKLRTKYPEEHQVFEEANGYFRIGFSRWISTEFVDKLQPILSLSDSEKLDILWKWYDTNIKE